MSWEVFLSELLLEEQSNQTKTPLIHSQLEEPQQLYNCETSHIGQIDCKARPKAPFRREGKTALGVWAGTVWCAAHSVELLLVCCSQYYWCAAHSVELRQRMHSSASRQKLYLAYNSLYTSCTWTQACLVCVREDLVLGFNACSFSPLISMLALVIFWQYALQSIV